MDEKIRRLQKDGEYHFEGLSREESRMAAQKLAKAAMREDSRNGVESAFGIARDAFGYYYAVQKPAAKPNEGGPAMRKAETKWKNTTTMENLATEGYDAMGAVLRYGEKVLVVGCERHGYHAAVYEMIETPRETGLGDVECRIGLAEAAEEVFEDGGHAMAWCISKI